ISPVVETVILKAMAEDPKKRYQTVADMYQAIDSTGLVATSASSLKPIPPPVTPPVSSGSRWPRLPWQNRKWLALLAGLLILLLVFPLLLVWLFFSSRAVPDPIKVWSTPNGELIGLSDGRYAFDTATDRLDASLKTQASNDLAKGDKADAESLWNRAAQSDTS